MFEILYNFTNGFKVMGYVLLIYILFVLLFNENVENKFPFIASYLILLTQGIFVRESLNKSFDRYKKLYIDKINVKRLNISN